MIQGPQHVPDLPHLSWKHGKSKILSNIRRLLLLLLDIMQLNFFWQFQFNLFLAGDQITSH